MIAPLPHPPAGPSPQVEPADSLLDHLVYATPDLAGTVAEFHAATGVVPTAGGRHVGLGTRNALVGLGPTSYLEIVGPDLENPPRPGATMPFGIADLAAPALVTWAVHPDDIVATADAASRAGADFGPPKAMQRSRPDGVLLHWRLALAWPPPLHGLVPFLIDWGSSPHPATGALPALRLRTLRGTHPDPHAVRTVLAAMDVRLEVHEGSPGLAAVLDTPRGPVELR